MSTLTKPSGQIRSILKSTSPPPNPTTFPLTIPSEPPLLPSDSWIWPLAAGTMFVQRTVFAAARRAPVRALAKRTFSSSVIRCDKSKWDPKPGEPQGKIVPMEEVKSDADLLPPGAKPGTIPTDYEQATGLERLELLGKMQGVDIFDMRPLDASRKGTLDNPILVPGAGDEQYAGCTGYPADSHLVKWLTVSRDRPIERCSECGNVVKLQYTGPEHDEHHGDHHHTEPWEPKTMADYVRPEYWYR